MFYNLRFFLRADVVSFSAQNVSFGMLVASSLTPWGTTERFRGTGEHKKEDLAVRVWISVDVGWISGPPFENSFGELWNNKCVFCHACLQVSFFS